MKHTPHNDPFQYDEYQSDPIWDFSWENDKWLVIGIAIMVVVCGIIYLVNF